MRSQVALCLQAQRSWQSAPKLPGGHSVGHSRAAQRAASHQAGWAVCMEQLYLTRRISQSIPVCRCRTHRWHCTALHSGRSKSAGSPARTAAVGSLQDKGTVLGTAGNRCPPGTGGCQGALQLAVTLLTSGTNSSRWAQAVPGDVVARGPLPAGTQLCTVCTIAAAGTHWWEGHLQLPSSLQCLQAVLAGQSFCTSLCQRSREAAIPRWHDAKADDVSWGHHFGTQQMVQDGVSSAKTANEISCSCPPTAYTEAGTPGAITMLPFPPPAPFPYTHQRCSQHQCILLGSGTSPWCAHTRPHSCTHMAAHSQGHTSP